MALQHLSDHAAAETGQRVKRSSTDLLVTGLLRLMAAMFLFRPSLKKYLRSDSGWIHFTVGIRTESGSVEAALVFRDGTIKTIRKIPADADIVLIFATDKAVRKLLGATPTEQLFMVMKGELKTIGNASYLNLFFFYLSLLLHKKQIKQMEKERTAAKRELTSKRPRVHVELSDELQARFAYRMTGEKVDPGVKFLEDPYLAEYGLDHFPRLKAFVDIHFQVSAEVCPERPTLVTQWHKEHGFEADKSGRPWDPVLRQGHMIKHLMENRKPIIRKNDLIAGTSTTKEIGVIVYPDSHGTLIWGELLTVPYRSLNPYGLSAGTKGILHHEVFPYWIERNFKEWVRA